MKITVNQLKRIIKEEAQRVLLEYEHTIVRRGDDLYISDDEGNETWYEEIEGSDYEYLDDGETAEIKTGPNSSFTTRTHGGHYAYRRY